jgi:hypothetical protein
MSTSSGNPIVDAIRAGTAPQHVRAAAARGALPVPRATLIQLMVELLNDDVESIGLDARNSLDGLETDEIADALRDEDCPSQVLIYFSKQAAHEPLLAECVAFHPSEPTGAVTVLAALGNSAVLDLVLTNEELLLQHSGLLEKMMNNPALGPNQRGRLLELLARVAKIAVDETLEDGQEEASAEQPFEDEDDLEEVARLLEIDVGELLSASEILGAEELEASEDAEIRNAFQRIIRMNTAQKAILAMKGGREERTILIRDTNKVVSMGVLKNPRITDVEVESIAKMRNVNEEVLRLVGNTREWVKSYAVIHALVSNPRTPQAISTNFIPRLNNKDLKMLVSSREVPELIRRMARKTFDQRNQRVRSPGKKH